MRRAHAHILLQCRQSELMHACDRRNRSPEIQQAITSFPQKLDGASTSSPRRRIRDHMEPRASGMETLLSHMQVRTADTAIPHLEDDVVRRHRVGHRFDDERLRHSLKTAAPWDSSIFWTGFAQALCHRG